MILVEYINYNLESSMYSNSYSLEGLRDWQSTKNHARVAGAAGMVVSMLPTAPLAIPIGVGAAADMAVMGEPHFLTMGTTILLSPVVMAMSIPASLIGGLMAGSWIVGRSVVRTVLRAEKGPHMFSSLTRKKQVLHKWDEKLRVALTTFGIDPSGMSTHTRESSLATRLAGREEGWFQIELEGDFPVKKANVKLTKLMQIANYGVAGALMHKARKILTGHAATIGLVGTARAGKSTFGKEAFGIPTGGGGNHSQRTRNIQIFTKEEGPGKDARPYKVIDFPGSNDKLVEDMFSRGIPLAGIYVLIFQWDNFTSTQVHQVVARILVEAGEDYQGLPFIICVNKADKELEDLLDDNESAEDPMLLAKEKLEKEFRSYQNELVAGVIDLLAQQGVTTVDDSVISKSMAMCCFNPKMQREDAKGRRITQAGIKKVKDVQQWCMDRIKEL